MADKTRSREELGAGLEARCDGVNSTASCRTACPTYIAGLRFLILAGSATISPFKMIVLSQILKPRQLKAGF